MFVLPYFSEFNPGTEEISNSFALGPMFPSLFILIIPVTAVVFLIREKKEKQKIVIHGLRNLLLLPTVLVIGDAHSVGYSYDMSGSMIYERFDWWDTGMIYKGLGWALFIVVVFLVIERVAQRKRA